MSTTVLQSLATVMVLISVAASLDCDRGKNWMELGYFIFYQSLVLLIFFNHFLIDKQPSRQNMIKCYSLRLNLMSGV